MSPTGVAILLVMCTVHCTTEGRFLRFEPGFEYQYKFHSDGQIHRVDTFSMKARVGYNFLREISGGQEVKLRVIALTLEASRAAGIQDHDLDFSNWFSFVLMPNGEITSVFYARNELPETLAIKKGLAALLASRLHDHSDQDTIHIVSTDDGWKYHVEELGHEGLHNATYEVRPSRNGKIFTKTRNTHPVQHVVGTYSKTLHYHENMQIIHRVEISEQFDVMSNPPAGYDPHIKGIAKPVTQDTIEKERVVLPPMTGEGHGTLEFLTRLPMTENHTRPDTLLVNGSILIQKIPPRYLRTNLSAVRDSITGNLTCMREQPRKGSTALTDCFFVIVDLLRQLSDEDLTILADEYLGAGASMTHFQRDSEAMLDALWGVQTAHAQTLLVGHVLLTSAPETTFAERLLYHIAACDNLPAKPVVDVITSLAFTPEKHAELFQEGVLHHRAVLTLGILIRLMANEGDEERATELANRLHSMLGLHDPWNYRHRRSTMTEDETIKEDQWKVVLLESLGNARLHQSYEYIVSHINATNSQWVKRAGVHALRDFHHDHAADVILMAALYDEHETVRYDASLQYRRHPNARKIARDMTAVENHHRSRRGLFDSLELLLKTPSVDWQKQLGSKQIGASFGLTIKNELDIKIGLLSGHGKVDVFDEAFGTVNLGFMNINVDLLRARLCFKGNAQYNLNIFQEFDVSEVKRLSDLFDALKQQTVDVVVKGVKLFRDLIEGNIPFGDIIKAFVNSIKNLPDKILAVGKKAYEALKNIGEYDESEMPPFIVPLRNLVMKISNLINDIRSDVMGFYNKLMTATVVIPYGGKQIFQSVKSILNSFHTFLKNPKDTISTITSSTLTIGMQVQAMIDAVKDAKDAAFFLKKEKPYWWDMRAQAQELLNMSRQVREVIRTQGKVWLKAQLQGVKDEIALFTKGNLSLAALKQKAIDELLQIPAIAESILGLQNLGDDIEKSFTDIFDLVENIKKAYYALKDGAQKAKSFIERVFGPKAHKDFPRVTRTPGGGCSGKGFYPSSLQNGGREYQHDGVDLLASEGFKIVAPFSGIIYLSDNNNNEVTIETKSGPPQGVNFVITNIRANDTIGRRSFSEVNVVAGQVIGVASRSSCGGSNHIHIAMTKGNSTIDPTKYLDPRFPEMPKWVQECDDYKFVYKGQTVAAGSIAGLAGRKEEDTSPQAKTGVTEPPILTDSNDPTPVLDLDVKQPTSLAQQVQSNKVTAEKTALTSNDSALGTLFKSATTFLKKFSIKDMKMGAIVKLLDALKLNDSLSRLTNVFKTIQVMLDNKPCLNPNQMSEEDFRNELRKQGKSTEGSRAELKSRFLARSDKCPLLSLGLPKEMFCTMDQQCLGLECCVDIKVAFFRKVYKLYARFEPCTFTLVVGIRDKIEKRFGPDVNLDDIFGGFEETIATGVIISTLNAELFLTVVLEKEDTSAILSVTVMICKSGNQDDCLVKLPVFDRAVLPLPVCGPDGSLTFPEVDLKQILRNQKDKFLKNGKTVLKKSLEELANAVLDKIPCLDKADTNALPCVRPDAMTEETRLQTLTTRGLDSSGTREEQIARLELADRTCSVFNKTMTLPSFTNSKLAKLLYVSVKQKCLGVEVCMDIPIPAINYSRSVRASMSLDPCMPTFHVQFETCSQEILLFNNSIDVKKEFLLSNFFIVKANVRKADSATYYLVDLGMKIQIDSGSSPLIDDMIVQGLQVPIPVCSDFRLPGSGSLRALASAGNTLTDGVVRYFMKTLKLDTVFIEGTCDSLRLQPQVCPWQINVTKFLPASFRDNVTCVMTQNCLGITCCLHVAMQLPLMRQPLHYYVPFHLDFEPCDNMKIDIGFGTYRREEHLLNYDFGTVKQLTIGQGQFSGETSPVIISFAIDHYRTMDPFDEGFLVDLNIRICIPFDGQTICFPGATGLDVLKKQKMPVCSPSSLTQIRGFNLTSFMENIGQLNAKSLTQSAVQLLLNKFGITDHLKLSRCDPFRQPYTPTIDGWKNECSFPIQRLPRLPPGVVCHLSAACNRLDCCFYSEFLNMTFNAWVELNCDLFIQAGIERLLSPRMYVLGQDINWKVGIGGEVNISEALRLEYLIRKDDINFILDATIKLCFDILGGGCQLSIDVMKNTMIPQIGCNQSAVSYFSNLHFFDWQICALPEANTGCMIALPASLEGKCVYTHECLGITCCVPVDLGLLGQYALHGKFRFDPCNNSFSFSIEQKSGSLALSGIVDVPQVERIGNVITFSYIVKKTLSGYSLLANLTLCIVNPISGSTIKCATYRTLPDDVSVYAPSSQCNVGRKKRETNKHAFCEECKLNYDIAIDATIEIEELSCHFSNIINLQPVPIPHNIISMNGQTTPKRIPCDQSPLSREDLMLHLIETEASMQEIKECMNDFKRAEESICDSLGKDYGPEVNMFTPKGIISALGSANPSTLIYCNKHSLVTATIEGGEAIQKLLRNVEDIAGNLQQIFVPGKGLTEAGAKALALKMANMTIGELQAYVMAEGIDPELAIQLAKDMKDLVYVLYSEVISSISNGLTADLFKSFDFKISGRFDIPRREENLGYSYFFLVGGLVPMTFKFGVGISCGVDIEVGAKLMSMTAYGEVKPYAGISVYGSLAVGFVLYAKLELTGYICQIALPSKAEITFNKFPLTLRLSLDLDLKPLQLRLAALVTIEVNLFLGSIKKTLFRANLWQYTTPSIQSRVLQIGKDEEDQSPPQFAPFQENKVGRRRRAQTTNQCFVRQLPGLDYTQPTIEIAVAASDDRSKVVLMAYAGTRPGLEDLLTTEMGGSSTLIYKHLGVSAQPVYFKVKATNNNGVSSEVTCAIATYDVTLPTGRLEAAFTTTSNKHELRGSLIVYEDSPIVTSLLAVGLGKGVYGNGLVTWFPIRLQERDANVYNGASDPHGIKALAEHFTDFKEGRLEVPARLVTMDTTAQSSAECAKKCMVFTELKCMSFNYHTKGNCQLLEAIQSQDYKLAVALNYLHYERLGVGLAHEFKINVPMTHNSLVYLNIYLQNSLEYDNYISSEGTLVDLTPPEPGPIVIAREYSETVLCDANLPSDRKSDWMKWCRGMDVNLPNHRVILDAPGSATIFNGHERLTDQLYTKANTFVAANWDGIHDDESGILGYSLTVGRQPCEEWLHPHHDPHRLLVPIDDDSQWTHIGIVNMADGVNIPDGKYYVTIRALNQVEYGGPLALTVCHTTPLSIDTSPPVIYQIFGTRYDEETFVITTQYNASDPHSDIAAAFLCLGRTVLSCDVLPWQPADTNTAKGHATIVYKIEDGVTVWIRLQVQNKVNLQTVGHADNPFIVDRSPPLAGQLFDGPVTKQDARFSKDAFQYCANWFNFTDPQSGINHYLGAVTSQDGMLLTNLTNLDRRLQSTCIRFDNPPLQHNHTYSFLLYAFNGGHRQLNVSAQSDGVLVDLTKPEVGEIIDGLDPEFKDLRFSVHTATASAQWRDFQDPESDIIQYEVQVSRATNLTNNFEVVKTWEQVGLATTFQGHNFHLNHRDVVKTQVRATNGALNSVAIETDSFIVDTTPPALIYGLWDGQGSTDVDYQTDVTSLSVTFRFVDEESGVDSYKYQVYQTMHGQRSQIRPVSRNEWIHVGPGSREGLIVNGLTLTPGIRYSVRVAAVNNAGAVATYDTNGVVVDNTPPVMELLHVGVLSSEEEVVLDGYVLQSDRWGIKATWLATDHESGITRYEVSVGTSPGATDVLSWYNMGREQDGYISGFTLQITNDTLKFPVYYVTVRANNGAGTVSSAMTSRPIMIIEEDQAGVVVDGGVDTVVMEKVGLQDEDYQLDRWTVTTQFRAFASQLHGLTRFDWAVGSSPGGEEVMPFMAFGIVHDETESDIPGMGVASKGMAQAALPLQPGVKYYTTVRALNNNGQAVQSTSDGFTVDNSLPKLNLISVSSKSDTAISPDTILYQREADSFVAQWNYTDDLSPVRALRYAVGSYPGGADIVPMTQKTIGSVSGEGAFPSDRTELAIHGKPNILTLWAEDSVGLSVQLASPSVVIDDTPPVRGQLICPSFIQSLTQVVCSWENFVDLESSITSFSFSVGTAPGLSDVIAPVTLGGYVFSYAVNEAALIPMNRRETCHIFSQGLTTLMEHNVVVYATVTAMNALNMTSSSTSGPIKTDTTAPVVGTVVELSDAYNIIVNNDTATRLANIYICDNDDDCQAIDVTCQESLTSVVVAWSPFQDPETGISRYEVAVGSTPGGGQLRQLMEVPSGQRYFMVQGLDLMGERQIFVTVKATNGAGASSTATSNGVFLSYLSQGLHPPGVIAVWDGDSHNGDIDYQTSLISISARWDTSADPCPAIHYLWAIERVDGLRVQDFYDTQGKTSGSNDGLVLSNLETYYQLVRVTNAIGYTYTLRSDGITIHTDPLIPGQVFDGDMIGFDLSYLPYTTKVSANWQGFGDKQAVSDLSGSEVKTDSVSLIEKEKQDYQQVARYEVALGTDRRFDKTRDNIVPWTDVGLNTSVTFYDLSLTPGLAIYYFSVRAYSTSNSKAEVTSNGFYVGFNDGVKGGSIYLNDYMNSNSSVEFFWSGFESDIGMFLYYAALSSKPVDNSSCQMFTDGSQMSDLDRKMLLDIADRVNTHEDTFVKFQNVTMGHNSDVYAHVIGVDRAGKCRMISRKFHIDTTPPVSGRVKTGPYYEMRLTFAKSKTELDVDWENFEDDESFLKSITVQLLMQPLCDISVKPGGDVITTVVLEGSYQSYTFRELELTAGHPYFVRITATNNADLSVSVMSAPLLYDNSAPVPGLVVDGPNFWSDQTWVGSYTTIKASILYLPTPDGPSCPSRSVAFDDSQWTRLDGQFVFDTSGRKLDLTTQAGKARVAADGQTVTITLTRDANLNRMYTTAMLYDADAFGGGTYELDIKAADGDGRAVTTVTLWDGESSYLNHYDYTVTVEGEFCLCCLDTPQSTDCTGVCDCLTYLNNTSNERYGRSAEASNEHVSDSIRSKRSVEVKKLTPEEKRQLMASGRIGNVSADQTAQRRRACGVQIFTLKANDSDYASGARGRIVTWCTFGDDVTYEPLQVMSLLDFDPSVQVHHYRMVLFEMSDESAEPTNCLGVYVDDNLKTTLCGVPTLSNNTKLVLSVWNWKNFLFAINETVSDFSHWQTGATFSNLTMPALTTSPCRVGEPFRGGQNPVVSFEAGIGSSSGKADIVPFRQVYAPCLPCVHDCDIYSCNTSCNTNRIIPLTLTLDGLNLSTVIFNDTSNSTNVPAIYYFTVMSVLGSGKRVVVSSNGFSIDTSPPEFDTSLFLYMDTDQGEAKPIEKLMASNSTIQVIYNCLDNESSVVDYQWAIGTTPGGEEIQQYTSTGMNPTGINRNLLGIIQHQQHYYVSVRCTNGGGLSTTYEDDLGIIAFIDPLTVTDVNGGLPSAEPIAPNAIPVTARKSSDPNSIAVSLTVSKDPTVDSYYLSIGSNKDTSPDDIFPRTLVSSNFSGIISIRDGKVYMDNEVMFSLRQGRSGYNGSDISTSSASDFHMEPGRELYAFIDSCNEARCTGPRLVGSVVVVGENSVQSVAQDSRPLTLHLPVTRRKRSIDQFVIQTPSDLTVGQSIVLTSLTHADLTATYESVISTSFVSYLTNLEFTLTSVETVDRILAKRVNYSATESVSFSLTSVGQLPMPGPVTITYPYDVTDTERTMTLLHWNPVVQKWFLSSESCKFETNTLVKDSASGTITVKVCDTYGKNGYFTQQTQFVVTIVNNTIPNTSPVLSSPVNVEMDEDEGSVIYSVEITDEEGDTVAVKLDTPSLIPDEGVVVVVPGNQLLFTPCDDCSATYIVRFLLVENAVAGIIPATTSATINIVVNAVNDPPVAFAFHKGVNIITDDPAAVIVVLLEQNRNMQTDNETFTLVMGAYDVDTGSTLTLNFQNPENGEVSLAQEITDVPDCTSSLDIQMDTVPCANMTLPHPANRLVWRYVSLTYRPNDGFYGYDTMRFMAQDDGGLLSFITTITFATMERPCQNGGTCKAKQHSNTCQDPLRAKGFDRHYVCNCTAGFTGLHCETDINDCQSDPCSWPLVCFDRINSYVCACPPGDPDCQGLEGWMIALIVISCLIFVCIAAIIIYVWALRTGRLQKWRRICHNKPEDDRPPTPPPDYMFTNSAYEEGDYSKPTGKGGHLYIRSPMSSSIPPMEHAHDAVSMVVCAARTTQSTASPPWVTFDDVQGSTLTPVENAEATA